MWSILHLTVFLELFVFSFSLEWGTHSLLQPGSCPNSNSMSLNIHQITGQWIIQHLPWPFPQCCQQPILNFEEDTENQNKTGNDTNSHWIRISLDWPNCKDQPETWQQPLKFRLMQNRITEGTFLIKLSWPFNAFGFATLNFVSIDYKKYAVAYICHTFLLEHIAIPFIMVRTNTDLDFTDWQRMKWTLIKQGILSAWTLIETKEQCNEVIDYNSDRNDGDTFHENQPNSSEIYDGSGHTESSNAVSFPTNTDEEYIHNVPYSKDGKTTETASVDPDAEWITTKHIQIQGPNQKPEYPTPDTVLWPAILMENQPASDQLEGNPTYTTAAEIAPLIAPCSGSGGEELGISDRTIELRVKK
ncbi:uncharacterized protein LOC124195987 [Daphnia pulex]|uniref:uncharacterized protein LOC124195987 n=1 Tax=Daphnia pulex TaxID=6669 RepID=UPI001EDDC431|nr:uncharacterized protein LOC124195987 [Daphnia pulex]